MNINVGVPHVNRRINEVRNSSYDIPIALLDLMDNVSKGFDTYIEFEVNGEGIIEAIIIRDNDTSGFRDILKDGCHNPLNMGHVNEYRHLNNDSNSEYGVGLKHASIFLANCLNIYTKTTNGYFHALLDFDVMSNNPSAVDSYNPVINKITKDLYKKNHSNMDCGSTIRLTNLRHKLTQNLFWQELKYKIQFTYNPQINDGKTIKYVDNYNYVIMKPLPSLSESRLYEERKMTTSIYFDDKGIECYADVNGQCFKWNEVSQRPNAYNKEIPKGLNTITIESSSIYGTCFDTNTIDRTMIENSEPYNPDMSELFKDELPKAKVRVYRDNRCLGTVPFKLTKENDGYHNYTIHTMNYKDKKLNKFFGVGSTKGNLVRRDYEVITFIEKILKDKIMPRFNSKKLIVEQVVSPVSEQVTESVTEQVVSPVAEQVAEPVAESVVEQVAEQVSEQVSEQVVSPVAEQVAESVVEQVAEQVVSPVAEQVVEPVAEPVVESVVEQVAESVAEPVVEPVVEPVGEPVAESVVESVVEQVVEQVVEPVTEQVVESLTSHVQIVTTKPYIKGPIDKSYKDKIIKFMNENFDPNDKDIIAFVNSKQLYL